MKKILTPEGQALEASFYNIFEYGESCSCHVNPPCLSCTHPGNPRNLLEQPEMWMLEAYDIDAAVKAAKNKLALLLDVDVAKHMVEMFPNQYRLPLRGFK